MSRPALLIATAVVVLVAALCVLVRSAAAQQPQPQQQQQQQPPPPHIARPRPQAADRPVGPTDRMAPSAAKADRDEGPAAAGPDAHGFENGRGAAAFFWIFAALTVVGSLFVITRRNLVAAVMGMVGTFFALAALYAMLYAHFLAVIQVLVYAGAIMVLFVFVIMILNRPEEEPWALQGLFGKAVAALAILYLVFRLSGLLWEIKDRPHARIAGPRPQPVAVLVTGGAGEHPSKAPARQDDFGSVRAVGGVLFNQYLFPFEAVSLILLVAVIGGIALARPPRREDKDKAEAVSTP